MDALECLFVGILFGFFFLVKNLSSRHLAAFLSRSNNEALNWTLAVSFALFRELWTSSFAKLSCCWLRQWAPEMSLFSPSIPVLMGCAPSKLGLSIFCLLINVFFPQKTIESETVKTSEVIKKKLGEITGTVKEVKGPFLRAALLQLDFWGGWNCHYWWQVLQFQGWFRPWSF